jgi:hypothetical protein
MFAAQVKNNIYSWKLNKIFVKRISPFQSFVDISRSVIFLGCAANALESHGRISLELGILMISRGIHWLANHNHNHLLLLLISRVGIVVAAVSAANAGPAARWVGRVEGKDGGHDLILDKHISLLQSAGRIN